jgi:hypothetical protein
MTLSTLHKGTPTMIALACVMACLFAHAQSIPSNASSAPSSEQSRASVAYGKLPLSFEPNQGQTAKAVQWLSRGPEYTLFLAGHDAVLELSSISQPDRKGGQPKISATAVRMNLLGAKDLDGETGEDIQSGKSNYFTGNDPSKWQRGVPMYGKLRLKGVYPGIDLLYYGRQGHLEYDFVVSPGADPSVIRWGFDGAKATLADNGDLVLGVNGAGKEIRLEKPVVYQMKDGVRQQVEGEFVLAKNSEAGFNLGAYDKNRELIIDPTLTFLGVLGSGQGNQETLPYGMALDSSNEIVFTGITQDITFPVTPGAFQTMCNTFSPLANQTITRCPQNYPGSGYVAKISADGTSLVFATYLHGISGYEYGDAVAIDSHNDEVILGSTSSYDFPVTANAYQSICQPYFNGTTTVETCDGYYSGGGTEYTIDGPNMFIAKLDPTGENLLYATFVGGTSGVSPEALALDSSDNMYFAGYVYSAWTEAQVYPNNGNQNIGFPTTPTAFQQYGSGENGGATLSVLSADGSTMLYSTIYGSSDTTDGYIGYDVPLALAVGPNGMAYMGGYTTSASLPTTPGAIKPGCTTAGTPNYNLCETVTGWLAAFNTTLSGPSSLVYGTYMGGTELNVGTNNQENQVSGLLADSSNNLFVTGFTDNIDFPITAGVYQPTCVTHTYGSLVYCSTNMGFLMKLNPAGSLTPGGWSTYYGATNGGSQTVGDAIALDAKGKVYLYGYNNGYAWDLPLVNPLEAQNGSNFAFVATFSPDATKLLFATPLFESCCQAYGAYAIDNNGMALDSSGNVYAAGYGNDGGMLVTTPGTYATPGAGSGWRGFFAKFSPVLPGTTTTLGISPSSSTTGQQVTFTATVAGTTQAMPVPTGTVTLNNINTAPPTELGTITLGANGSGTFMTSSLAAGTYSVTGTYSGDSNYDVSTSTAQPLTVTAGPSTPTVSVMLSSPSITTTQALTVSVAVSGGAGNPTPTGSVMLSGGGYTSAATMLSGGSTMIIIPAGSLSTGTDTLTVTYTPDANSSSTYSSAMGTNSVTVTATQQTINFPAPASPVSYGVSPIALSATASSGLTVVFTVASGPGTINGNMLTITGVGTVVINANQAGNATYAAAPQVQQSVVVIQATQTINFTPPASPIPFTGTPIMLVATGGGSGNPVVFSIVSGPGTINGSMLTLTGLGTVVIAANQAGNSDYLAAAQVEQSIVVTVIGTVASPTFTPVAGTYTGAQSVTIADTTMGAMIYYTTDGSIPPTSPTSIVYSNPISVTASETINAIAVAPDYNNSAVVSAPYVINLLPPDYTVSFSPSTLTIEDGQSATTTITVTPQGGFDSSVSFTCSAPFGVTCGFSPGTVTPSGNGFSTSTLTISTFGAPGSLSRVSNRWFPETTLALALCLFGWRKRRGVLQLMLLLAVGFLGLSLLDGCGGGTLKPHTTAVIVQATSGQTQHTASLTVIVDY